jgi:hypothetical protein
MALLEKENILGFVDKRRTQATTNTGETTPANLLDVAGLRARLVAINSGYWNAVQPNGATRLDNATKNDMVYAVRLNDEAAGI